MLIDSHAHYDDERFEGETAEILADMKNNKVSKIINVGCDLETSKKAVAIAEKYDFIYAAVGFHPHYADKMTDSDLDEIKKLTERERVVAYGEIGLDYHYDYSDRKSQKAALEKQLFLAKSLDLPVIIHLREATEDLMSIIRSYKGKGVFHCYSGSVETAKEIIKLGYYISFSGTVTYKNAHLVKEAAKWAPSDRYIIETDCPYLAPEPVRGTRNDSRNLKYTANCVAELRGISFEQLAEETTKNALALFGKKIILDN